MNVKSDAATNAAGQDTRYYCKRCLVVLGGKDIYGAWWHRNEDGKQCGPTDLRAAPAAPASETLETAKDVTIRHWTARAIAAESDLATAREEAKKWRQACQDSDEAHAAELARLRAERTVSEENPIAWTVLSTHSGDECEYDIFWTEGDAQHFAVNNGGVVAALVPKRLAGKVA